MPTLEHIQREVHELRSKGQDTVRHKYLKLLHEKTGRDTVLYFSSYNVPRAFPIPGPALSIVPDDIQGFMASLHQLDGRELDLIIHSPGGSLEGAEQIVQYLRSKYDHIRTIVPQNAMSAATMLACASDEILMGKHSAIGPIDPQISLPAPGGVQMSVPAYTILQDFNRAKAEIAQNPVLANLWVPKLAALPMGFLTLCEQTTQLAEEKVALWLKDYMFRNDPSAAAKAQRIARWLSNFDDHRTHGRPIGIKLAAEHGLKVSALEEDQELQELVLSVFHATMATFQCTNMLKIVENHRGIGHYLVVDFVLQPPPGVQLPRGLQFPPLPPAPGAPGAPQPASPPQPTATPTAPAQPTPPATPPSVTPPQTDVSPFTAIPQTPNGNE